MARPREFDEEAVLAAARDAFWARGYEATSTRALVRATGLSQPSLYNAFGDKRGLFRAALAHYLDETLSERIARLEASPSPARAVTAFMREVVERSAGDTQRRGCMLVNSALEVAPEDDELRAVITGEFEDIRSFFERCMRGAYVRGDVPQRMPARDASHYLLAILIGLRVLARLTTDRARLSGAVAPALALLGLPPLRATRRMGAGSAA
jgi:TetR/AcrR family transcriptional regulator, transcriptional repressor for nem operon